MKEFEEPTLSADAVLAGLSLAGRVRYAAVGLAGLTVALLVGALWATEPSLPLRTHVAFGGIVAAGLGWAGFAGWTLTRRVPLFARDRVIAGVLALTFSGATAVGLVLVAATRGGTTAVLTASATGLVLVTAALALLVTGRRRRAELLRRKAALTGR
ncbi:transmembrane transport protein [Lentzea tibetensis]|uniref:Transmembrane transport protein n=1 Tax=Lentzea tibetensis TaxID=2591470 RepID=A0A563EU43_9PSEU|nr:transmembrane transport protein [Lentzea tibetensis]TWP51048.1 transmembrane transport protein [Lentzea tibetensis]